jgi:hypothetical protein
VILHLSLSRVITLAIEELPLYLQSKPKSICMKSHFAIIIILGCVLAACKKDHSIKPTADAVKEDYLVCSEDSWVAEQNSPAYYNNIFFVYNNKVYVPDAEEADPFNQKLHVFDGSVWTEKDSFTPFGACVSFFTIGSKGYAIAWGSTSCWFYEYNILTDNWTRKADFPGLGRQGVCSFTLNGKGYVVGGSYEPRYVNGAWGPGGFTAETWEYNPATNTWTQRHNLPLKRAYSQGFTLGNKGYVVNGTYPDDLGYLRGLVEYDPATDRWTSKSLMPGEGRESPTVFVIDGVAYAGGGRDPDLDPMTDFYRYNLSTDSWTRMADIPAVDCKKGMFSLNGKGYIVYRKNTFPTPSGMKKYNPKYCVNINIPGQLTN